MGLITGAFKYSEGRTPERYACAECGATGVRLFRGYQSSSVVLHCTKHHDPWTHTMAVPTEDGGNFWGLSSIPKEGLHWWHGLPTEQPEPRTPEHTPMQVSFAGWLLSPKAGELDSLLVHDARVVWEAAWDAATRWIRQNRSE